MYSIVIPWSQRGQLATMLLLNRPLFERHDAEVIIVHFGGPPEALSDELARAAWPNVRRLERPELPFNRSAGRNIGAVASRRPFVVLLDADIVLTSDVLDAARDPLKSERCFVAVDRVRESAPAADPLSDDDPDMSFLSEIVHTTEWTTRDGRAATHRRRWAPDGSVHASDGLVLLRREDLLRVGGLHSDLITWGYEDTDLQVRLQLLLGLRRIELGEAIHLTHGSHTPQDAATWRENMKASTRRYARGDYLGTLEADVARWDAALPGEWQGSSYEEASVGPSRSPVREASTSLKAVTHDRVPVDGV